MGERCRPACWRCGRVSSSTGRRWPEPRRRCRRRCSRPWPSAGRSRARSRRRRRGSQGEEPFEAGRGRNSPWSRMSSLWPWAARWREVQAASGAEAVLRAVVVDEDEEGLLLGVEGGGGVARSPGRPSQAPQSLAQVSQVFGAGAGAVAARGAARAAVDLARGAGLAAVAGAVAARGAARAAVDLAGRAALVRLARAVAAGAARAAVGLARGAVFSLAARAVAARGGASARARGARAAHAGAPRATMVERDALDAGERVAAPRGEPDEPQHRAPRERAQPAHAGEVTGAARPPQGASATDGRAPRSRATGSHRWCSNGWCSNGWCSN
jgi:hypothetical protein